MSERDRSKDKNGGKKKSGRGWALQVFLLAVVLSALLSFFSSTALEGTGYIVAALVPGAVINISYESETGNIWIVMPDAAAGWSRVQQQTAATDGKTAQITYEQIAAVCGDDVSTWGARMQFESDGAWKVYAVTVGQSK